MALFSAHPLALQAAFSDLKRQALEQRVLLVGSPGAISEREVNKSQFYYRQFYDANGKKAQEYLGAVGARDAEARVSELREQIDVANALLRFAGPLSREGYVRAEPRTSAVLAALANDGFFRGGGVLVGSHAYGVLLNDLGIRAGSYATEDVDVARPIKLALPAAKPFAKMLAASTLELFPVPALSRKAPSTSYKAKGADRFRVDLLAPARGSEITTLALPELSAHATALPFLGFLLEDSRASMLIGREAMVPVRVPSPARFAFHKLWLAESRRKDHDKRKKDVAQAAVLLAALAEDSPHDVKDAFALLPRGAKSRVQASAPAVRALLEADARGRALSLLSALGLA